MVAELELGCPRRSGNAVLAWNETQFPTSPAEGFYLSMEECHVSLLLGKMYLS